MTAASADAVLLDRPHPGIARITLNRPDRLNAINNELLTGLYAAYDAVDADLGSGVQSSRARAGASAPGPT